MKILIADDQEENRYLLEALLRANGHEVRSASNGQEAMEYLESGQVEMIITDILMPVMDGFELCRRVRKSELLRHIPLIFYTATYTGPQDEAFAIKIGADRFILKPCEPDVFVKTVQEVMESVKSRDIDLGPEPQETEVLKLYNERLVRKLEQKMMQLEKETRALRETQEALSISERKYRRLHESMTDGYAYVDMKGVILESNESFREMIGYTEEELSCLTYLDLTPEKWHAFEQDIVINQVLINDFSEVYEKEYRKKDGSIFPVELKTFLIRNETGQMEGMWAIVRDITERRQAEKFQKKLEDQLVQSQKMEMIGRLAGGVAHDFNNLLSIILGYGELMLFNFSRNHPHYEFLKQIHQAGIRAKELTRQLLAFSRKQVLEMKIVDINQVVTGFEKLLRRLIGEDIKLILSLSSESLMVNADIPQVEQVLMNLAVNARDAMPEGGSLTIETTSVELDETTVEIQTCIPPGTYAMIGVSDIGSGMDRDTLEHIFEPFFTTKGRDKGTGLGLATCYGIVKQHQGGICAFSNPGEGTTFRIYLPLSDQKSEADTQPEKSAPPVVGSATVLIVEDDLSVRELTGQILADHGYTVIESEDVTDAITKAASYNNPIHLVISDVIMPGMKGPEAFAGIREHHPEARVLYMSGYPDDIIIRQGVLKEGIQYIQKPFTINGLLEKCHQVLQGYTGR